MPLTLDCFCPDNDDVAGCELVELWFEGTIRSTSNGGIDSAYAVTLYNGASEVATFGGPGNFSGALDLALVDDWPDLHVTLGINSSSLQFASPGAGAFVEATWLIRAVYECAQPASPESTDPQRYEVSVYTPSGEDFYNWVVEDVTVRSYVHVGNSGGVAVLYRSEPLTDNGAEASSGAFDALPGGVIDLAASEPDALCLCAEGGTGPYMFSVAGLPAGLEMDKETGCITGEMAEAAGPRSITFTVTDSLQATAHVTCTFMAQCGGAATPSNVFVG